MNKARKFLLVDENPDGRSLIARTLHRKFPAALTLECVDADTAFGTVSSESLDAVIVHRAADHSGFDLIRLLRAANADVPILALSGMDRTQECIAAGATRFLHYDQWLLVGTVVAEMLGLPSNSIPLRERQT